MQREGAVPDGFVKNKMTRTASSYQSTKHLELLARRGGKWCLDFAVRLRAGHFQHHKISTDTVAEPGDRMLGYFQVCLIAVRRVAALNAS
jgi:hypothetical protein